MRKSPETRLAFLLPEVDDFDWVNGRHIILARWSAPDVGAASTMLRSDDVNDADNKMDHLIALLLIMALTVGLILAFSSHRPHKTVFKHRKTPLFQAVDANEALAAPAVGASNTVAAIEEVGPWPFYARNPLSSVEQVLYFRLCKALPQHMVLAQVQLSRMLGVKKGHNPQAWFNRISRMSADFVICTRDARVVAVIELDDASHQRAARQEADAKKDKGIYPESCRCARGIRA